jgi:long-subunit fatty acid transport protein
LKSAAFLSRGGRTLLLTAAGVALSTGLSSAVRASPLDDPHIGGIGFSSPAAPELSAMYWNPAAIGLVVGNQATLGATGRFTSMTLTRTPIDGGSGLPGGNRRFAPASGHSRLHPVSWPLGPGGFLGLAASVGSRFTFGLATYSPFNQQVSWSATPDGTLPARYQAVATDLRSLAVVTAVSIRLGGGVRFGAAPGFLLSLGRLSVDEDTALRERGQLLCNGVPCGAENPDAAARYDVSSGFDFFDGSLSLTLAAGLHIDRPRWMFGVTYISRPLGTRDGVEINGRATRITPALRDAGTPLCPPENGSCVYSEAVYQLPDTLIAGLDLPLDAHWLVGVVARWLNTSLHDAVRIRLTGPANGSLRTLGLPQEVVLHRGLRDVYDLRLRAVYRFGERVQLAGVLRGETASVSAQNLSPGFVDGFKIEPGLAARIRVVSGFSVTAGYAFTFFPSIQVDRPVFDPTAVAGCQDAGGDLGDEACRKRQAGQARPTTAGRYRLYTHSFSLAIMAPL